jgi:CRP-like cAMP-binding protein
VPARPATANRIFDALIRECPKLGPRVTPIRFAADEVIYQVGDRLSHVYFPTDGALGLRVQLRDGGESHVLSIGPEGFLGLPVWLGLKSSEECVVAQVSGEAQRLPAAAFCDAIDGSAKAGRLFKKYAAYSLRAGYQNSICTGQHDVVQRTARWLLATADRAAGQKLDLSQAVLAQMLSVRRQSVGAALGILADRRTLERRRGMVLIRDRKALEAAACECHGTLSALYCRLVEPYL